MPSIPERYIKDILSGKIPASEYVRKSVERHVMDLEKQGTEDFPYTFVPAEGQRVIKFFSLLRHSKGEWAGSVFKLSPWQEFLIYAVFGWRTSEGTRRFRTVYLEVPRKNGKTTLAAGIGLYLLRGDNEPGAEIYAAATKYDQAKLCHTEAVRMVKSSPGLRGRIKAYRNNLSIDETNSNSSRLAVIILRLMGLIYMGR